MRWDFVFHSAASRWSWAAGGSTCSPKTSRMWNIPTWRSTAVHVKMGEAWFRSGATEWRTKYIPPPLSPVFIFTNTFAHFGVGRDCSGLFPLTVQKGHYVWNKKQLLSLNPNSVDYLLGELIIELPVKCKWRATLYESFISLNCVIQVSLNPEICRLTWRGTLRLILRSQRWWKWPSRSWGRTPVDSTCW